MKSKEEIKAIRDSLENHLDDSMENETHFIQGLIRGAIDGLNWAMGDADHVSSFFYQYSNQEPPGNKKAPGLLT
jgi:hypothetical protein